MHRGYIKLWRRLRDSEMWLAERFTRGQAWVDLLLLTNYTDGQIRKRGIPIDVHRGEIGWSEEALAARWHWSRGKVRRYMTELASKPVQQIEQQKTNVTSLIKVTNWELYQGNDTTDGHQNDLLDKGLKLLDVLFPFCSIREKIKENSGIVKDTLNNQAMSYETTIELLNSTFNFGQQTVQQTVQQNDTDKELILLAIDYLINGGRYSKQYSKQYTKRTPNGTGRRMIKNEKNKNLPATKPTLPEWIDPKLWQDFREHRQKLRKPMTTRAEEILIAKLDHFREQGHNPRHLLITAIERGWQSVFAPKDGGE